MLCMSVHVITIWTNLEPVSLLLYVPACLSSVGLIQPDSTSLMPVFCHFVITAVVMYICITASMCWIQISYKLLQDIDTDSNKYGIRFPIVGLRLDFMPHFCHKKMYLNDISGNENTNLNVHLLDFDGSAWNYFIFTWSVGVILVHDFIPQCTTRK